MKFFGPSIISQLFPAVLDTHFTRISQFWDKAIFDPKTPDLGFLPEKFSMFAPFRSLQWAHFPKQYKNIYQKDLRKA